MSSSRRLLSAVTSIATNPLERRAYRARLQWLVRGSGSLPAWSLEYRAGLTGVYATPVDRSSPDPTSVRSCPPDCGAHAPLSHLYEQRFVYRAHNTVTSTITGATIMTDTPTGSFFVRESISWPFESILSHGLDIPETRQAQPGPSTPTLVFESTANYYHWLVEELPLLLRGLAYEPNATVVVAQDGVTERHRLVARALGIELRPSPPVVRLREHILPGRANDSWFVHPADAALLFDVGHRIAAESDATPADRLYISRRFAARSLPQEERIEAAMSDLGFHVVHLEQLPWSDQIRLFQHARVIVGPHGAGLSNLVFTPPGATVIEITNGLHYNRCFEWICHIADHRYRMVGGAGTPEGATTEHLVAAIAAHLA